MATSGLSSDDGNCEIMASKDPLQALYPMVNEVETPLPRSWSSKDKFSFIGLSQNDLRVHYKGCGKTHKDAASVRATHHIPAACGLYYYEVKIVSKGRDGYMGIGLSAQGVSMNRLPGWDKNSYGYHGDDGHSFCSSGTGQSYGPTFTTGDIIGCGINLIDNVCFYTKNGQYLGIAFTELPSNLYPTVGLQTPGEVVDANFGKTPFVFDINDMMSELQSRVSSTVQNFPVADTYGEWQAMLHKMVSTYLVHHGYCSTAEAFARSTSQDLEEEINSIKNRQKIQKLVLSGRLGEAIRTVTELYSGFLEKNRNLLFMLKVRQFIEMVNGTDSDILSIPGTPVPSQSPPCLSPSHSQSKIHSPTPTPSPSSPSCWTNGNSKVENSQVTAVHHTSVIQSTKSAMSNLNQGSTSSSQTLEELNKRNAQDFASSVIQSVNSSIANGCTPIINPPPPLATPIDPSAPPNITSNVSSATTTPSSSNSLSTSSVTSFTSHMNDSDVEMDYVEASTSNRQSSARSQSNGFTNGFSKHNTEDDMDVDASNERKMCGGNPIAIEKTLMLGRELQIMSQTLRREKNKTMLQDAFSLLAYNDPWNSPVGWQLDPIQRESVCQALNSAILESHQLPRRPPLEICISHTRQLIKLMCNSGLGSSAFASVDTILDRQQVETTYDVEHLGSSKCSKQNEKLKLLQSESPLIELQDTNSSDFQYSSSSLDLQLNPSSQ